MPKLINRHLVTAGVLFLSGITTLAHAAPDKITVKVDQPGITISPKLYGMMTEEINYSYEGGLYGELIRNRVFKNDPTTPVHWSLVQNGGTGTITLDKDQLIVGTALTTSLKLDIAAASAGQRVGVANDGYWGIPARPNTKYSASFYAKAAPGFTGPITVSLESVDGKTVRAKATVTGVTGQWKKYTVTLKTGTLTPSKENRLVLSAEKPGTLWFNQVSLFPPTYKGRKNGNRIDLMEKMADLKPTFLRLPGGNYLEGNTIAERFDWKATLGDISERPGHQGPWGYRSNDGMGLMEFLTWCEDLNIEPILGVFAGYALHGEKVTGKDLEPFVQDALDEIEFLTGDVNTKWGAIRAKNGHPKPFPLTYVEIGNEDWLDRSGSYESRYPPFHDAIKAKYPKLQLIATTEIKSRKPDLIDEHFYRSAVAMERDANHYDKYDRNGPKIFVGEWATTEGRPTPTYQAALGDAAWMTGMERNSDIVVLEAYAPLFVNVNPRASQWGTNLIGYDALNSFGSPSFYVQSLFGKNTGDVVLPTSITLDQKVAPPPPPQGKIGVSTWITDSEYKDIEVTKDGVSLYKKDFSAGTDGWTLGSGDWKTEEGSLRQTGDGEGTQATAGDTSWRDYTYHLKARKLSGREGFMVLFHVKDDNNLWRWNIGGWGNTRSAIQRVEGGASEEVGSSVRSSIETGRWYDIRIELRGGKIQCYLDDKLVNEATEAPRPPLQPLYVAASRVQSSGEVILKVVNVAAEPHTVQIDLQGAKGVAPTASAWVLSGRPEDQNTIAQPEKVAPKAQTITGTGANFTHEFPAYSVTVLRVKTKK